MKFLEWVKSFLENRGTTELKYLGIVVYLVLVSYMIISDDIKDETHLRAFFALLITASVWVGIVSVTQVASLFGRNIPSDAPAAPTITELTATVKAETNGS